MNTHQFTRPGMQPIHGELIFTCPNFYVALINGKERTLLATDGKLNGFTVKPLMEES